MNVYVNVWLNDCDAADLLVGMPVERRLPNRGGREKWVEFFLKKGFKGVGDPPRPTALCL